MDFELSSSNQLNKALLQFEVKLTTYFYKKSKTYSNLTRLIAAPIGIASFFLLIIKDIVGIAERIIKGTANLFGAPFSKKCSAKIGASQLLVEPTLIIITSPFLLIHHIYHLIVYSADILIEPSKTLIKQINHLENNLKKI